MAAHRPAPTEPVTPEVNRFKRRHLIACLRVGLLFMLAASGLWLSATTTFGLFGLDPDTSHDLLLWHGFVVSGLGFIPDWKFTPDNWLFTLTPIHFLTTFMTPRSVVVHLVEGWLIFLGSAILVALILRRAGSSGIALGSGILLFCVGYHAIAFGLVSHAFSHNSSNFLGLIALYLTVSWIRSPRLWRLAMTACVLTISALSDPWMLPAYELPIAASSIIFLLRPQYGLGARDALGLLATTLTAILISQTRLFGAVGFLPKVTFLVGDSGGIAHNVPSTIGDLGALLNLLPLYSYSALVPGLVSIAVIAIFLGILLRRALRPHVILSPEQLAIILVGVLSVFATLTAVIISKDPTTIYSTRFLINTLYMVVMLAGLAASITWRTSGVAMRLGVTAIAGVFVFAGLSSQVSRWKTLAPPTRQTGVAAEIAALRAHALTYGYGPYWGSLANAVTAGSGEEIRMRPVSFNGATGSIIAGERDETSSRWYRPDDQPPGLKKWFVMVAADDEECQIQAICVAGLVRQFGVPKEQFTGTYAGGRPATVLVWDHPLIGRELASPIAIGQVVPTRVGSTFLPGQGWSTPETWGIWTDGPVASFRLRPVGVSGNHVQVSLDCHGLLGGRIHRQLVKVYVNGVHDGDLVFTPSDNSRVRTIVFSKQQLDSEGAATVVFQIGDAASPRELGTGQDDRKLGLALVSLKLDTAP